MFFLYLYKICDSIKSHKIDGNLNVKSKNLNIVILLSDFFVILAKQLTNLKSDRKFINECWKMLENS